MASVFLHTPVYSSYFLKDHPKFGCDIYAEIELFSCYIHNRSIDLCRLLFYSYYLFHQEKSFITSPNLWAGLWQWSTLQPSLFSALWFPNTTLHKLFPFAVLKTFIPVFLCLFYLLILFFILSLRVIPLIQRHALIFIALSYFHASSILDDLCGRVSPSIRSPTRST